MPNFNLHVFVIIIFLFSCKDNETVDTESDLPKNRDKYEWPFSSQSIWNMPIGSDAKYEAAQLPVSNYMGVDEEWHIHVKDTDPIRDILAPSAWDKRWPGGDKVGECPIPDNLIIPDASPPNTPNACTVFFLPDGKHIKQLEPACRAEAGKQIVGYVWPKLEDLYGEGIGGTHWGSGLSALGGSIRAGELKGSESIHHALKLNVWGKHLYYGDDVKGFRWPATVADSYADKNYLGTNPKLVMGSLLAIPPSYTMESLNIQTDAGKKIFNALQNYGAYISDDSGWNA